MEKCNLQDSFRKQTRYTYVRCKKNSLSNSFFLLPKLREESSIEIPIFENEASFDPPFLIYAFISFLVHASRSKDNSSEYCRP